MSISCSFGVDEHRHLVGQLCNGAFSLSHLDRFWVLHGRHTDPNTSSELPRCLLSLYAAWLNIVANNSSSLFIPILNMSIYARTGWILSVRTWKQSAFDRKLNRWWAKGKSMKLYKANHNTLERKKSASRSVKREEKSSGKSRNKPVYISN